MRDVLISVLTCASIGVAYLFLTGVNIHFVYTGGQGAHTWDIGSSGIFRDQRPWPPAWPTPDMNRLLALGAFVVCKTVLATKTRPAALQSISLHPHIKLSTP